MAADPQTLTRPPACVRRQPSTPRRCRPAGTLTFRAVTPGAYTLIDTRTGARRAFLVQAPRTTVAVP
jgi:hypothetical protein